MEELAWCIGHATNFFPRFNGESKLVNRPRDNNFPIKFKGETNSTWVTGQMFLANLEKKLNWA